MTQREPEQPADQGETPAGAHTHEPLRPGWNRAPPEHLARPSYWPATMALGITFLLWGLISTPLLSAVGLVVFGSALIGWIGDIWNDHRDD